MVQSRPEPRTSGDRSTQDRSAHRAGALDIRVVIAMLLGVYGVVLVLMALFATSARDLDRAGGLDVNLWAGLGMLVVAAVLVGWARLRPVVVPDRPEEAEQPAGEPGEARD